MEMGGVMVMGGGEWGLGGPARLSWIRQNNDND